MSTPQPTRILPVFCAVLGLLCTPREARADEPHPWGDAADASTYDCETGSIVLGQITDRSRDYSLDLSNTTSSVSVFHKVDIDAYEDRCINRVQIELFAEGPYGGGCRILLDFVADGGESLVLASASFAADSFCPGWPDHLEGMYQLRSTRERTALAINPLLVPDRVSKRSCADLDMRGDRVQLGGEGGKLFLENLAVFGRFDSAGSTEGICPFIPPEPEAEPIPPEPEADPWEAERAQLDVEQSSPIPAERLQRRAGRLFISWTPGFYSYSGNPCSTESGPCEAPSESALESFDFLKTDIQAVTPGSFSVGGEWFPGQEVVGVEAEYSRVSYTTDFAAQSGGGGSHCDTHFCDSMNYINVGARFRIPLLKDKGPLDLLFGVGPSVQDVTVFWRRPDANGDKEAIFETINLVGLRVGVFGLRYTAVPQVQPHFVYNLTFGLRATLGGDSFGVPGIINHNVIGGVTFFPWKGLMLDASYTMLTRSVGLSFWEEGGVQRGTQAEATHSLRVSAGLAF